MTAAESFAEAIVRGVPETLSAGITSADLGKPDHEKAREQHRRLRRSALEGMRPGGDRARRRREVPGLGLRRGHGGRDRPVRDRAEARGSRTGGGRFTEVEKALSETLRERRTHHRSRARWTEGTFSRSEITSTSGLTSRTNREGAGQLAAILGGTVRCLLRGVARVPAPQDWGCLPRGQRPGRGRGAGMKDEFGGFDKIVVPTRKRNTAPTASGSTTASSCRRVTRGRSAQIAARGYERHRARDVRVQEGGRRVELPLAATAGRGSERRRGRSRDLPRRQRARGSRPLYRQGRAVHAGGRRRRLRQARARERCSGTRGPTRRRSTSARSQVTPRCPRRRSTTSS